MHKWLAIPEIILSVAEMFDDSGDLSRLTRCCRNFRTIAAPLLLRCIDIPLDRVRGVLGFSAVFPFGGYTDIRLSSPLTSHFGASLSRRSHDLDAWSLETESLLDAINLQGTLRGFAWDMLQPLYIPAAVCDRLATASMTLETLFLRCILFLADFESIDPSIFSSRHFPSLRSLEVHVLATQQFDMAWLNCILERAPTLETLILVSTYARNFELQSSNPRLRNIHIQLVTAASVPGLPDFLRRHSLLERVGLRGVKLTIEATAIPGVKALMIDRVTNFHEDGYAHAYKYLHHLQLQNPSPEEFVRLADRLPTLSVSLLCLEIDWTMRTSRMDVTVIPPLHFLFPNLRELGVLTAIAEGDMGRLYHRYLRALLHAASQWTKLVALRIWDRSYELSEHDLHHLVATPPCLRYVAWDGRIGRTSYVLRTVDGDTTAIKIEPPILRTPRSDWTGDSVFDHLAADPGY